MDPKDLNPEQKQEILRQYGASKGRQPLFELEALLREIEAMLLEEGVDEGVLQFMSARVRERWARPSMMDRARSLFPVQSMPLPSVLVYDRDPGVAEIITTDDESEE